MSYGSASRMYINVRGSNFCCIVFFIFIENGSLYIHLLLGTVLSATLLSLFSAVYGEHISNAHLGHCLSVIHYFVSSTSAPSAEPRLGALHPSSCEGRMTSWWTRWRGQSTMRSVSSSGCLSPRRWYPAVVPSRPHSPYIWRTLQHL